MSRRGRTPERLAPPGGGARRRLPVRAAALAVLATLFAVSVSAEDRVPRPDFSSGYEIPTTQTPSARSAVMGYVDVAALALALTLSAWLALRGRSRTGLFLLGVGSLVYFGFIRRGCICPVGSLQNVVYALVEPSYRIPAPAVAFFVLPLLFALVAGRVFCGGVCPLGAIQDLVLIRPLRLPRWLTAALGLLPPVYLGLALLAVLTRSDFLVCRFDPFVGFFRFSAELDMAIAGLLVLGVSTVVGRPYCRFLCPYSVLLKLCSRLSWRHLSSTPGECVNCRLCEKSCPFGAIDTPEQPVAPEPREARRLMALLLSLPLLAAGGALLGYRAHALAALANPTVRLAREVRQGTEQGEAFLSTGTTPEELERQAAAALAAYGPGTAALGAYSGLLFGGGAVAATLRRRRLFHAPHRALCLSCGRCIASCPKEQELRRARLAARERRTLAAMGRSSDARP